MNSQRSPRHYITQGSITEWLKFGNILLFTLWLSSVWNRSDRINVRDDRDNAVVDQSPQLVTILPNFRALSGFTRFLTTGSRYWKHDLQNEAKIKLARSPLTPFIYKSKDVSLLRVLYEVLRNIFKLFNSCGRAMENVQSSTVANSMLVKLLQPAYFLLLCEG